ncbi:MAG: ethylbenzene dehydrogenase-related protein [Fidelibacterota bacterium]
MAGSPGPELRTGVELYGQYCSSCHGPSGHGDGSLAYLLYPKPRDFTQGLFKLRSTPSGELPTREDLRKTIVNGMPGTAMPSFYFLKDQQIEALVEEVRKLGGFEQESPRPVSVPGPLPFSGDLVAVGKSVYADLGCHQCHGELGKGDGPSAGNLKDDWGYPIPVRDFTRGTYVGGGELEDLYLRFATGMDGTPMPSYLSMVEQMGQSEAERQRLIWGLVYYVKSLETEDARSRPGGMTPPEDGVVAARKVFFGRSENYFLDGFNRDWKQAPVNAIPLSRLWQKERDNLSVVTVRALYSRRFLAVRMEWTDESRDTGTIRVQDFQDGAAVQFSLTGEPGFHGMGSRGFPANLWFWRSEWEIHRSQMASLDIEQAYPNRASDADVDTYPETVNEQAYLPGRDAGSLLSLESIPVSVEDLNAVGPGTLESQPLQDQSVTGKGVWDGNRWTVVFVRSLKTGSEDDIQFKAGGIYPVAFAVWNGSQGDRNGQKMVSTWYRLKLE